MQQILYNRDIPVEEQEKWLDAGLESINDYHLLRNIKDAAVMIGNHCMWKDSKISILQDCDVDGCTSVSIIANYINRICGKEPNIVIHKGKAHGLADIDLDEIIDTTDLLILPDSSSNDYEQNKYLKDNNVDVCCLAHPICEKYSEDAIVVNNQLDNYPNKDFSGAGITWQLCRMLDELFNFNYAKDYIDLCALGNLSDMMLYTTQETRAIVKLGTSNLHNKFISEFVKKQEFSLNKMNGSNYLSWAFYITLISTRCVEVVRWLRNGCL